MSGQDMINQWCALPLDLSDGSAELNNDQGIMVSVHRTLGASGYSPLGGLECDCMDGVLVIWGSVSTYYLKQVAQQSVMGLPGVRRVENRVDVMAPLLHTTPQGRRRSELSVSTT